MQTSSLGLFAAAYLSDKTSVAFATHSTLHRLFGCPFSRQRIAQRQELLDLGDDALLLGMRKKSRYTVHHWVECCIGKRAHILDVAI